VRDHGRVTADAALARRWDPVALAAALVPAAMTVVYLLIMRSEGDTPAWWFVAILALAVVLCGHAARRDAPRRRPALLVAGAALLAAGVLALLSIGLPLLVAGALALGAGLRR
jgi:hypothetical protein